RGLLIHHYKVDEHKIIKEVKLFIATEFNLPLIDTMITNVSKELYEKTGDLNMIKEESQKIIRCFDPCVSCATH
ncbi:MAG: Ni/Fe hydrogenase subunit alpha, partial [Promethearchaeota archaeon]